MSRRAPQTDQARPPRSWKRRALIALLGVLGLCVGFLIPYAWYLDGKVQDRFGQLQWQQPTRVYARPLELAAGLPLDANTLLVELAAAGYRDDGTGQLSGSFARDGARFTIATRGFVDYDGAIPPARVQATVSGGRVTTLKDAPSGRAIDAIRLDPARIATLYGSKQEERRLVRLEDVPPLLVTGIQAVEDRNFKNHHGIDPWGITRAMWVNLRRGGLEQGGSTITQLLARSGLLGIGQERTLARKFNEVLYALIIDARYDKRTILEAFFNQVYLGQIGDQTINGVAAASEFWFGRDLQQLRSEDIALLIGMVKGPSHYDPRRNPERARNRRNVVLNVFAETGLIDAAELARAKAAPLGVSARPAVVRNRYPAFMDLVRTQLARDYPAEALSGAGLAVLTSLSPSAQIYAEDAVRTVLPKIQRKQGPPLQAGLVVTDTRNGEVTAMVGNRKTDDPGFNRALEARRPVGSLLKPFVYLLALAQPGDWSLASMVDDAPVSVTLGNGRQWTPGNSDGRSHGRVRLIDALAQSYNQATVRVGQAVSTERLAELMRVLAGLKADANPSLILGAVDLSPYAMAQMYQFLASGGEIQPLRAVRAVIADGGQLVNRYDNAPEPAQGGDAVAARLVTLGLQSAVSGGTGRQLVGDGLGRLNIAGKTGTSNDGRDSWFAGYTADRLAVVWVGNDQNEATGLYGGTGAMRVWSAIFAKLPSAPLTVDGSGLEWAWMDPQEYAASEEGCPGARRLPFVQGYVPALRSCQQGGWRNWFGLGADDRQPAAEQYERVTPTGDGIPTMEAQPPTDPPAAPPARAPTAPVPPPSPPPADAYERVPSADDANR